MRTGVKLRISRRLGWNALGLTGLSPSSYGGEEGYDSPGRTLTYVRLEVSGLDGGDGTLRSAMFETALERVRDCARVTFSQEGVGRRR